MKHLSSGWVDVGDPHARLGIPKGSTTGSGLGEAASSAPRRLPGAAVGEPFFCERRMMPIVLWMFFMDILLYLILPLFVCIEIIYTHIL